MRVAQRMGLNSDGTSLGLPPFETEMRRRLWWQLVMIDNRVAEVSGAPSLHATYSWSTHPPSNVNDNDLFPGMRDITVDSDRLTEMLFVSLQCELFEFTRKSQQVLGSSTSTKDEAIDAFQSRLESRYLKHCDPSAPVHLFSILTARLGIWKLRMGVFSPRMLPDPRRQMPRDAQDGIFSASLGVLECYNAMLATESVQNFIWYAFTNPPFTAYLHLLCALRTRTNGELADRAWHQLAEHAENREKHDSWDHPQKSGPLRLAIGNLTIKAWEAREMARSHFQPVMPVPRFISGLRDRLAPQNSGIQGTDPSGPYDSFVLGGIPSLHSGTDIFSLPDFLSDITSLSGWPTYNDFTLEDMTSRVGEAQYLESGAGSR
jgi:hypothetical protein